MPRYIINKGAAGLGNRLVTVAAAIDYANKFNRVLLVDWSDGVYAEKGINIFNKFFKLENVKSIHSISQINNKREKTVYPNIYRGNENKDIYYFYRQSESKFLQKINRFNPKGTWGKLLGYWQLKDRFRTKNLDIDAMLSMLIKNEIPFGGFMGKRYEDIVVFADYYPKYNPDTLRKCIVLHNPIQAKINAFCKAHELNNRTIGVHVRNTDKKPISNLNSIFAKIRSLGSGFSIFLSTDNAFIEREFTRTFSNIITYPKAYLAEINNCNIGIHHYSITSNNYYIAEQILEDSIIDMHLLSKCDYLIYQKNSSFSEVSAALKDQPEKTLFW